MLPPVPGWGATGAPRVTDLLATAWAPPAPPSGSDGAVPSGVQRGPGMAFGMRGDLRVWMRFPSSHPLGPHPSVGMGFHGWLPVLSGLPPLFSVWSPHVFVERGMQVAMEQYNITF